MRIGTDLVMLALAIVAMLLAPSLVGCSAGRAPMGQSELLASTTFHVDHAELGAAQAAADEWNAVCGFSLSVSTTEGFPVVVGDLDEGTLGYTTATEITVTQADVSGDPAYLTQIFAHEFGHHMLVWHTDDKADVMFRSIARTDARTHVRPVDCF